MEAAPWAGRVMCKSTGETTRVWHSGEITGKFLNYGLSDGLRSSCYDADEAIL